MAAPSDVRGRRMTLVIAFVIIVGAALALVRSMFSDPTGEWGPLAVAASDLRLTARYGGTLHITEKCVFIAEEGTDGTLLVWHPGRTEWRARDRAIVMIDLRGTEAVLRNGDRVFLGGGGSSASAGGPSAAAWSASIDWISKPDASCPMESRWFVNGLSPEPPTSPDAP